MQNIPRRWLVFDVENTLIDEGGASRQTISRILSEAGVDVDTDEYAGMYTAATKYAFNYQEARRFLTIRQMHILRLRNLYQVYGLQRDPDVDLERIMRAKEECPLFPDVLGSIDELSGEWALGIISNADEDDPIIKRVCDCVRFDCVVTSEVAQAHKPDARLFELFLARSGASRGGMVFVGDHQVADVLGGKQFGLEVVWLNRNNEVLGGAIPTPDYEVRSLVELPALLR